MVKPMVERYRLKDLERVGRVPRNVALYMSWGNTNLTYVDDAINDVRIVNENDEEMVFDHYFEAEPVISVARSEEGTELYVLTVNELGELILWTFERVES